MRRLFLLMCFAPALMLTAPAAGAAEGLTDPAGSGYTVSEAELEKMAKNLEDFRSAILSGNASRVRTLLEEGVNPNILLANGDTPLTYAYRSDAFGVARELLEGKLTDLSLENRMGESPLMMAVFKGRRDDVELLLQRGAAVNKPHGWTPLHYAATQGEVDMMKRLIELGAAVNAQTRAGVTPLHMAARKPSREAVMTLLRAGAYRDYCTDAGLSPADFARNAGDEELGRYLAVERCAVKGLARQASQPAQPSLFMERK